MLGQTDNIIIIPNNIIRNKTSLQHRNQGYIITYQYNKIRNNIITLQNNIIRNKHNIIIIQNIIIRHKTS